MAIEVHFFNIRITEKPNSWMWYANLIDSVFLAKNHDREYFMLASDQRVVLKTDCEIVK